MPWFRLGTKNVNSMLAGYQAGEAKSPDSGRKSGRVFRPPYILKKNLTRNSVDVVGIDIG